MDLKIKIFLVSLLGFFGAYLSFTTLIDRLLFQYTLFVFGLLLPIEAFFIYLDSRRKIIFIPLPEREEDYLFKGIDNNYIIHFEEAKISVELQQATKFIHPMGFWIVMVVNLSGLSLVYNLLFQPDPQKFYPLFIVVTSFFASFFAYIQYPKMKGYKERLLYLENVKQESGLEIEIMGENILITNPYGPFTQVPRPLMKLIVAKEAFSRSYIMDTLSLFDFNKKHIKNPVQRMRTSYLIKSRKKVKGDSFFWAIVPQEHHFELLNKEFPIDFHNQKFLTIFGSSNRQQLVDLFNLVNYWINEKMSQT
ncbi:MAG: hypothetical protein INQ03_03570 [Candidatus Heimdallarchaeota archaeon]|nr:hypothetical protein [Candidatus Heimdallarchaeota archaeon]